MSIKLGNVDDKFVAYNSEGNPLEIGGGGLGGAITLVADASDALKGYALTTIPALWTSGMSGIKALHIGQGVTSIGGQAFLSRSTLTGQLIIPNSVTTIGNGSSSAFNGCSGFTGALNIPHGVLTIGVASFNQCTGLSGLLTIPASVTSIGSSAFSGCAGLTSAHIRTPLAVITENNALGSTGITTVRVLASDVTWTVGSGQTIAGKSGITVIKDLY